MIYLSETGDFELLTSNNTHVYLKDLATNQLTKVNKSDFSLNYLAQGVFKHTSNNELIEVYNRRLTSRNEHEISFFKNNEIGFITHTFATDALVHEFFTRTYRLDRTIKLPLVSGSVWRTSPTSDMYIRLGHVAPDYVEAFRTSDDVEYKTSEAAVRKMKRVV